MWHNLSHAPLCYSLWLAINFLAPVSHLSSCSLFSWNLCNPSLCRSHRQISMESVSSQSGHTPCPRTLFHEGMWSYSATILATLDQLMIHTCKSYAVHSLQPSWWQQYTIQHVKLTYSYPKLKINIVQSFPPKTCSGSVVIYSCMVGQVESSFV